MKLNLILLSFMAVTAVTGVPEEIAGIIADAELEISSGELYSTEVTVNSAGMSFPGVGTFDRSITFLWAAEPWTAPGVRLVAARVFSRTAAVEEQAEYLFEPGGNLVFCRVTGGYDRISQAFYFHEGRLIRFMEGDMVSGSPEASSGREASTAGKELRQAFLLLH